MRDSKKNVNFVFKYYEKQSADFKIRLRYDNLQQGVFFRSLLDLYLSNDPLMLEIVEKIKIKNRSQGKAKLTKTKKDFLAGKSLLEGLGISDKDRDDIFDLIELDNEGMYD